MSFESFRTIARAPKFRRAAIAVAGAAAFGCGAAAMSGPEAAPPAPAPLASISVSLVAAEHARFDKAVAATGTLRARDELIVGSDSSGVRLVEVRVEVGSVVRKGELLALADDAQLRAQLEQQRAQVRQAAGQLVQARANAARATELSISGVYSAETRELRETDAVVADASLELARARLRELEIMVARTRIVAPADGVVSSRTATVGAVIQPGAELFRVIRDGSFEWLAELPAQSLAGISPGAPARVVLDDGRAIDAQVRIVEPSMSTSTRNGLVHVLLPPGTAVIAGSHARGQILLSSAEALALPESSVFTRDGYAFVYTVDAQGTARRTKIETGARQAGRVEVTAGLAPGTRVVGTGAGFVKDGELVQVVPAAAQRVALAGAAS